MPRSLRITLKLIAILFVLIIGIAVALPFILDPNDFKPEISDVVKKQTGRTLQIKGDIGWSFFPWLGIELGEMALGNAKGFGKQPFARLQSADVRVKLLPLFKGNIEIGKVTLHGMQLSLQRKASGVSNWDDLQKKTVQPPSTPAPSPQQPAPAAASSPAVALAALAIEGIEIKDAAVIWDDQQTKQHYTIKPLNLEIGKVALKQPIPIELDMQFVSKQPAISGSIQLNTQASVDLEQNRYTANKLALDMTFTNKQPTISGSAKLNTQINVDLQQNRYTATELRIYSKLAGPLFPGNTLDSRLAVDRILANLDKQTLSAEHLALSAYGIDLHSDARVTQLLSSPAYTASLSIDQFVPAAVVKQLGITLPKIADSKALQQALLNANIKGTLNQVAVNKLILQLDDSELTGNVSVSNFAKPAVRYALNLNQIDVDRYLPPPAKQTTKSTKVAPPATAAASQVLQLPVKQLRALDINGSLRVNKLKAMNLHSRDIRITTVAKGGRIRLHPLGAQLYQGSYSGDMGIDVTGKTPRISMNEVLKSVQIGPLLKDLWGDDKIRGTANLNAKLTASGVEPMAIRKTLNGTAGFEFKNGAVKGFNIAQYERELRAKLKGQPVPKQSGPLESDFARLFGTVSVNQGVATNRDLSASLPHARVSGQGQANLVNETVDYTARVKFTSRAEGQGGKAYAEMDKVPLPIRITGTFSNPKISPDFNFVLKELAKRELEKKKAELKKKTDEKVEQEKEKLKRKLEQKAGDALKKLFKF